jgi:hypothetical protein
MSVETEKVLEEALKLDASARAFVAESLLESLDLDNDVQVSDAWREEVRRRCVELERGVVTPIDGNVVLAELRAKYGS